MYNGPSADGPLSICALYCTFLSIFHYCHFFHVALFRDALLFSCCMFFMLNYLILQLSCVALFSCCILFRFPLFSYCTIFMLLFFAFHSFYVALFSCCIFSCSTFFVFRFSRVVSFCTLFMLYSFRFALFSC